jgi:hypothetical protein
MTLPRGLEFSTDVTRHERDFCLARVRDMVRIRRLEERCAQLYGEQKIRGFLHLYVGEEAVAAIHRRFTYRMHDLSQFMKTVLQRFTRWFNREHERRGVLWEERFKSVIVESGVAARTIAAYIDLNPVRAGLVADPADAAALAVIRQAFPGYEVTGIDCLPLLVQHGSLHCLTMHMPPGVAPC